MWPFRKKEKQYQPKFSNSSAIAIIIAVISLAVAAGVARWSWLMLDEQIQLRKDFEQLKARQDQVGIQYEFWLKQIQEERAAVSEEETE